MECENPGKKKVNKKLQAQLKDPDKIKAILKEVSFSFKLEDGRDVTTLLIYLPVTDGAGPYVHFFEQIRSGILQNFVFSSSEVEKKLGLESDDALEELFNKAVRKLSKHTAKGELGELILFTVLDVYFQAPKILSKVSMKSNPRMPVFGADAVHGQFVGDHFRLYLGESKLHKDCTSAATSAADSIEKALGKYKDEFDLLDSYMDFPGIDEDIEGELLSLLNPFSETNDLYEIHSPCFIGFSSQKLIEEGHTNGDFELRYIELAKAHISHFFTKVDGGQVGIDKTALMLLPFSCVEDLVEQFVAYMGIEN